MDADEGTASEEGRPVDGTEWPLKLRGVTETIVTTLGPNGLWNVAALGVFAPEDPPADTSGDDSPGEAADGKPATARTWGNTRTRRNFHRQGEGSVQFVHDPEDFVAAAMTITEREEPLLDSAQAWARIEVESLETGNTGGTDWERWALEPSAAAVERTAVTPINRGFGAVIEATVAASRLGVSGYDDAVLEARLAHCLDVVDRTGGPAERRAFARLVESGSWNPAETRRRENEWL